MTKTPVEVPDELFRALVALEVLTPLQRAVLLLRDVLDFDLREAANALDVSPGAAKAAHHRARKALERYDTARAVPSAETIERWEATLTRLMAALGAGDVNAFAELLTEDVRTLNDAGGRYLAALKPVVGRDKVARLYHALSSSHHASRTEVVLANGLPALLLEAENPPPRESPRALFCIDLAADGRVRQIDVVIAPEKLVRLCGPAAGHVRR